MLGAALEKEIQRAERFLWAVRCHLHLVAGRAEERLTFDYQREIAARMNYADRPGKSAVERFMRHYFLHAKTVGDLTGVFLAHLDEKFGYVATFRRELNGPLAVLRLVSQQMGILLHRRSAASGVDRDTVNAGNHAIVVDLARLDYISSAGLRVLLGTAKKLTAAGGALRTFGLNDTVREVFDISGFSTILRVFPSEADALNSF